MTSEFLPLKSASKVAFIDDDRHYLNGLQMGLPDSMTASFHIEPSTLGPLLDLSRKMLQVERDLLTRITPMNGLGSAECVSGALQYLASPIRFDIVSVLIADFAMPQENGVNLCRRFQMAGLRRLLLTGMADQAMAVSAFNAGAIEQYVPKQSPNLMDDLVLNIGAQIDASCDRRGEILLEPLQPEMRRQLMSRPVAKALGGLLQNLGVTEWVLVAQPQGLVCVTADGGVLWVQLENEDTSKDLAEGMHAEDWNSDVVDAVIRGSTIVDLDFASQMNRKARAQPAIELQARPRVCAAVFEVADLPAGLRPATRPSPPT